MDLATSQAWFRALPQSEKVLVLLGVMREFTLIVRFFSSEHPNDCEKRWQIAYRLSEINHRLTSAASALMKGEATFPDDLLIEMVFEQPNRPDLEPWCREALTQVMRLYGQRA